MAGAATIYRGIWWLPGQELDDGQPGSLIVNADQTMRLELIGGFEVMEQRPSNTAGAQTEMHDTARGTSFTASQGATSSPC